MAWGLPVLEWPRNVTKEWLLVKAICTVVARNYLAHARVLARSFRAHHPDAAVYVLVLDDVDRCVDPSDQPFFVVRPADVVPDDDFRHMRAMYDVTELATAVKPWLLRWLLEEQEGQVCYLDPDIQIFSRLHEVVDTAKRAPIALTPHLTAPLKRDGCTPDEDFILKSGVFNLGFLAVAPGSEPFLDWWGERLRTECIVAPSRHRFVDQRWVDMATGLFEHEIIRHPGYNVAYWNISTRLVTGSEADGFLVDGQPLRFFHFSGYSEDHGDRLSRHAGARPRHVLSETPVVAELAAGYGRALRGAGVEDVRDTPYAYGTLPDGTVLDRSRRRAYRAALVSPDGANSKPPDPFDDTAEFERWFGAAEVPSDAGWRYTDRWTTRYPAEMEHLLMALSLRPGLRRWLSRGAVVAWRLSRRLLGRPEIAD